VKKEGEGGRGTCSRGAVAAEAVGEEGGGGETNKARVEKAAIRKVPEKTNGTTTATIKEKTRRDKHSRNISIAFDKVEERDDKRQEVGRGAALVKSAGGTVREGNKDNCLLPFEALAREHTSAGKGKNARDPSGVRCRT